MSISNSSLPDFWHTARDVHGSDTDRGATLPERIERTIAELVQEGVLAAGTRLPSERELARIFAVSRLAVREAAHRLEARGLVTVRRGSGCFVTTPPVIAEPSDSGLPVSPTDPDELVEVRMLLEPAAADWAARRASRTTVAMLERIVDRFESAAREPDPRFDLLVSSYVDLHREIAHAADNALLAKLIDDVQRLYATELEWSLRRPGRLEGTARETRRIVEAIRAGDPSLARDAMTKHLVASEVVSSRAGLSPED